MNIKEYLLEAAKPSKQTIDWWNSHNVNTQKQWIKDHPEGHISQLVKANVLKYGKKYGEPNLKPQQQIKPQIQKQSQQTQQKVINKSQQQKTIKPIQTDKPKKSEIVVGQPVEPNPKGPIPVPVFTEPKKEKIDFSEDPIGYYVDKNIKATKIISIADKIENEFTKYYEQNKKLFPNITKYKKITKKPISVIKDCLEAFTYYTTIELDSFILSEAEQNLRLSYMRSLGESYYTFTDEEGEMIKKSAIETYNYLFNVYFKNSKKNEELIKKEKEERKRKEDEEKEEERKRKEEERKRKEEERKRKEEERKREEEREKLVTKYSDTPLYNYFDETHGKKYEYFEKIAEKYAEKNKKTVQKILLDKIKDDNDIQEYLENEFYNIVEGDQKACIEQFIHEWAHTSGDDEEVSLKIQKTAKEEFKLDTVETHFPKKYKNIKTQQGLKKLLRKMYEETQKQLKENNIPEKLVLYRGVGLKAKIKTGEINSEFQPLSSFSLDLLTSHTFAENEAFNDDTKKGYVLVSLIDRKNILSTPHSGFGCSGEKEFVVLSNKKTKTYCINIGDKDSITFFEYLEDNKKPEQDIKNFILSKVLHK
jgi:hypothetical protein